MQIAAQRGRGQDHASHAGKRRRGAGWIGLPIDDDALIGRDAQNGETVIGFEELIAARTLLHGKREHLGTTLDRKSVV